MSRAFERYFRGLTGEIYLGEKQDGGGCFLKLADLYEHGHFLGRTGSGKTRVLQQAAGEIANAGGCALLVLDPYGDLAHYIKDYCYESGLADRLITLDPGDALTHGILTGFNPLIRAASPQAAAAASTIALKSALGDTGDLIATPRLAKWSYASFLGLQRGNLTMGDCYHVVDPSEDARVYREIFGEQLRDTDPQAAALWRWLVSVEVGNPTQAARIFEEQLGSFMSRLSLYTKIPQIAAMLLSRRFGLDALAAIQGLKIVVANLARFTPAGLQLYTEQEQKLLGTQILHTFLAAGCSRPPKERTPLFVMVDEFEHFLCPEVETILSGGRQFGVHLLLAHQYLHQLQDVMRDDWRYYQAVIGMPRVRVVFGEGGTVDAETMSREIFYKYVDLKKEKDRIYRTIQIQRVVPVTTHVEMSGGGETSVAGTGLGSGSGISFPGEGADAGPGIQSLYDTMNSFNASGANSFYSSGSVSGLAVHPDPPTKEVQSREFWSALEQLTQYAQQILRQPRQHALLAVRESDPVFFKVADVADPTHDRDEIQPLDRERLEAAAQTALPSPTGEQRYLAGRVPDILEEARARDADFRKLAHPRATPQKSRARKTAAKKRLASSRKKRTGE